MMPATKLSKLRGFYAVGDMHGALRIAAKFPDLGPERGAILTAWGAIQNPRMYEQMGNDPQALVAVGVAALRAKYKLDEHGPTSDI